MQTGISMMSTNIVRNIIEAQGIVKQFQLSSTSFDAFFNLKEEEEKSNKLHQLLLTDLKDKFKSL